MSNKIHVSQIDTGVEPGKIPVFSPTGQLRLVIDPIDKFDAVTKNYIDSILSHVAFQISELNNFIFQHNNEINNIKQTLSTTPITNNSSIDIESLKQQILSEIVNIDIDDVMEQILSEIKIPTPVEPTIPEPVVIETPSIDINNYKKQLCINVDTQCALFSKYEWLYKEKFDQAIDFLSQPDTTELTKFPLLQVDVDFYKLPVEEVINNIIAKRKVWISQITIIEHLRLTTKRIITDTNDIDLLTKIYDNFLFELSQIDA